MNRQVSKDMVANMTNEKREENSKKRTPPEKMPWDFVCMLAATRILELPDMNRPQCVVDRIRQEVVMEYRKTNRAF